jgi:Lrp/AsnC family transcriptional regulator, leucine-responsive regulatory protein
MDATDHQLVQLLQENGRATQLQLAREVGLSQPAVAERMKKLEAQGVIRGYSARVDPAALGSDVLAFVSVSLEHPKHFDSFITRVLALPYVLECHRVAGEDSFLLKVRTENTGTLDDLLVKTIRMMPGVTRTQTTIVLRSIKEEIRIHTAPRPASRRTP